MSLTRIIPREDNMRLKVKASLFLVLLSLQLLHAVWSLTHCTPAADGVSAGGGGLAGEGA